MRDDPAFIRTIAASPDDDAPRLVYADVLDESGEPAKVARADFIRVQVEKSRLNPDTPRSNELWHRERELFDWARQWRAELPSIPGVAYGGFIRGFIDRVDVLLPQTVEQVVDDRTSRPQTHVRTLERSPFLDRAAEVFDMIPVRKLRLSGVATDGAERLVKLQGFTQIVDLGIEGSNVTPMLFDALIARGPWPNLRRLQLAIPHQRRPPQFVRRLTQVFRHQLV